MDADDHGVTVAAAATLSGVLYTPAASILIGTGGDVYGAMVALDVIAD